MSEERAGLRTPAGRHRLTLLTLAHAFATVNYTAVVAMAPALQAALGLSRAEVGLFATVFYGGLLAGSVPLGWVVDRVGVRPALVAGHLVMAVTSLALSRVESFGTAAGCLLVGGFGYAALNPATAKAILGWFPAAQRATAMGIKQTGVPLGGMVAAAAVPLAAAVGWRPVLWIVAGLVTAGGVLCATLAEPRDGGGRRTPGRALGDLVEVLGNRNLAVFNLASAAFTAAQTSFLTYLTLFVGEAMGGGPGLAGLCLATAHAGSIGGRIGWGLVSDRWLGGQRKLALLLIGMLAAALLAGLALVRPGGGAALGLTLALALGLTVASHAGLGQAAAVEAVDPRLGGAAIGYNMVLTPLGGMVGPPLFGGLVDRTGGWGTAWLAAAGLVVGATLLLALGVAERPRDGRAAGGGSPPPRRSRRW